MSKVGVKEQTNIFTALFSSDILDIYDDEKIIEKDDPRTRAAFASAEGRNKNLSEQLGIEFLNKVRGFAKSLKTKVSGGKGQNVQTAIKEEIIDKEPEI